MKQKRFDFCSIAGKNPAYYKCFVDNVLRNSGLTRDEWEFHTIVYRNSKIAPQTTDEICKVADDNFITIHFYDEVNGDDYETFLYNLYACWHLCQITGETPYAMRAGSDQAFGPNAFRNMVAALDGFVEENNHDNVILFHNCIESAENVKDSRHILESFGRNWLEFKEDAMKEWCAKNEFGGLADFTTASKKWGAPRNLPGCPMNDSADGCSWLQSKQLYKSNGPMVARMEYGTGDITLMMRYRNAGVPIRIVGDSTTYHFSRSGA